MMLRDQIDRDLSEAMKKREEIRVSTLRLLRSQMMNERFALRRADLDDEEVLRVIRREVKRRLEARESYVRGGRAEEARREEHEQHILEGYLPSELSDDAIRRVVETVVAEARRGGSPAVGSVMGMVMKKLPGHADGRRVRAIVENVIPLS